MNLGLFLSPGDSLANQRRTGQLERFIRYYLKPYSKYFNQIFLFTYGESDFHYPLPKNFRLKLKPCYFPNYLYQLLLPFCYYQAIKQIDVNRIFQAPGGFPALISKIIWRKPYIVTYGYDYVRFAEIEHRPILARVFSFVIPLVLRFASKIIVTSADNLVNPKIVIIRNGVDPRVFKPSRKPRQPYLVLSVGRLANQKNYEQLIKAVSLSRFKAKINLVIIGNGPLKDKLMGLSRKLNVRLKIIPNKQHIRLSAWYQRAAVFALTSRIEGQSKVLLEALSSGCACLTTKFSGNIIKDKVTGLIAGNPRQLALKLNQLLSDNALRQQLGRRARIYVRGNFDIKKLVDKEIRLLKSIAYD